jgi:hypothetical protein
MTATVEIDEARRITIPEELFDSLHLVTGARVTLREVGGELVVAPEVQPRGLYMDRGTLVYDAGPVPQSDVVEWITEDREARARVIESGSKAR